mgnify:CR=1 FL=1
MSTFNPEMWSDNNQLLLAFTGSMKYAPKIWWWAKYIPKFFYPLVIFWLKKGARNIECELKTLSTIIEENPINLRTFYRGNHQLIVKKKLFCTFIIINPGSLI